MQTSAPPDGGPEFDLWRSSAFVFLRGVLGGAVGGVVGYLLFRWLLTKGFYALVMPGALLGLGAGLATRGRSQPLAIVCAIAALCLAIFAEWSHAPFKKPNEGLFYFVTHLHQLDGLSVKFIMMGLGVGCAYWFAKGR